MNSFVEILKQFSPKHKAWVLFMLLAFTTCSFLGGKYFDGKQKAADVIYIDSIRTVLDKNCELQKQQLLKTQSMQQEQINDILSDLINLRQIVMQSQYETKTLAIKTNETPKSVAPTMSWDATDTMYSVYPLEKSVYIPEASYIEVKDDSYKKICIEKLTHLIKQTKSLTK